MEYPSFSPRRCGARARPEGGIEWRVWAPRARAVELVLIDGGRRRLLPMEPEPGGFFRRAEPDVPEGQRYAYRLEGGPERPDPCSLWQPEGVHGPSAVVRPGHFRWTDRAWRGVPREDLVLYELHVGTFTPEGTFAAVQPRLEALRRLGVTAVELMPVAQFPGTQGWGYDGVSPYAAQDRYGGPHGLQRLVDACHAAGLASLLRSPAQQRLAASLFLLSPYVPLLFMGEEYGEENPFPFFCSFGDPQLVEAVREGRRREFSAFAWKGELPDPHAEATFDAARLSWSWPEGTPRAGLRRLYADLLAARREWPALRDFRTRAARLYPDEATAHVLELIRGGTTPEPGRTVRAVLNLTGEPEPLPEGAAAPPDALLFSSESAHYAGTRQRGEPVARLRPYECVVFGPVAWRRFA